MMRPELSIIIVNWNTRDLLVNCLESITQTCGDLNIEIIVIDNASTDGSQALLQSQFSNVQLIANQQNLGFARANNQGITQARGRYVLLLNSDTIILPDTLEALLELAREYTDFGIIGCKLLNADGSLQESWASFPNFWSEILGRNFRHRRLVAQTPRVYEVDWLGGACMLVNPAAIEQVGLLDEAFFMYSEEADWCYRLRQHGWRIYYLADAKLIHLGGGSASRASTVQLIRLYESKILFFAKHYGLWQAALLRYSLVGVNLIGLLRCLLIWLLQRRNREELWPLINDRWRFIGQLTYGQLTVAGRG